MRRLTAGVGRAFWASMIGVAALGVRPRAADAQGVWNDPRSRALVELATRRRAEQLADTGLVDYRANAKGYVSFLAQFGDGFLEKPQLMKTDQLALEVYWHAPNLSKQRIIGRRDTLLLPTDIQYHRDHLGIVQNNFPDFIRLGDGDEVRDVPHPLSKAGLALYDFALSDSVRIALPGRDVHLLEVKVRPKDDRQARVIGAVYIDPSEGQVVKMAFNFTHAAFLDQQLEDLAIVLENRLVGARYWLPSSQQIEIRRTGTWLDFPVKGIIRGRWEIGDYQFNLAPDVRMFAGPEIVLAPPQELAKYVWPEKTIMESLPPDVRSTIDPDVQRIQDEARVLVRAKALERAQAVRFSAPRVSDFVRVNRVEGLAIGTGFSTKLSSNLLLITRGRFGFSDNAAKGAVQLRWQSPTGSRWELFASRDHADIGDVEERSALFNDIAAQEFGSDLTDPYGLDAAGVRVVLRRAGLDLGGTITAERHRQLFVNATPSRGFYEPVPGISSLNGGRIALSADRARGDWVGPGQLQLKATGSILLFGAKPSFDPIGPQTRTALRGALIAENRIDFGSVAMVFREQVAAAVGDEPLPGQSRVYFGGPQSLPGYAFHSVSGLLGSSTRLEVQVPIAFPVVPLGRFGRAPALAHLDPYVALGVVDGPARGYPAAGVGLTTFFDAIRFDVARGLRGGRWIFSVDVSRDFWSIL